ncbi:hypothetical protein ACFWYW_58235 [Nonomuraea sp. NPDC059023]|uniref:hypothetical protein n=1 Tax=unclassified Nonomuraea TaxID=2593643 RepID=UPI003679AB55
MRNFTRTLVITAALATGLVLPAMAQATSSTATYSTCTYRITVSHHFVMADGSPAFLAPAGKQFVGHPVPIRKINGVVHRPMQPFNQVWGQVSKMREIPGSCQT